MAAPQESVLEWCHVEELNGDVDEEGEKTWLEVLGLPEAPLLSNFLERKASGLERKQEARAETEVLGESVRLEGRWLVTGS